MKYSIAIEIDCGYSEYFVINNTLNKRYCRSVNINNALHQTTNTYDAILPVNINNFTVLAYFDEPSSLVDTHPELFI